MQSTGTELSEATDALIVYPKWNEYEFEKVILVRKKGSTEKKWHTRAR